MSHYCVVDVAAIRSAYVRAFTTVCRCTARSNRVRVDRVANLTLRAVIQASRVVLQDSNRKDGVS